VEFALAVIWFLLGSMGLVVEEYLACANLDSVPFIGDDHYPVDEVINLISVKPTTEIRLLPSTLVVRDSTPSFAAGWRSKPRSINVTWRSRMLDHELIRTLRIGQDLLLGTCRT
jgi:hypothetical protein